MFNSDDIFKQHINRQLQIKKSLGENTDLEKGFGSDLQKRFPNGRWVTSSGSRVFINNGKVIAGLDGFNGTIDEAFKEDKDKKGFSEKYDFVVKKGKEKYYVNKEGRRWDKVYKVYDSDGKLKFTTWSNKPKIKDEIDYWNFVSKKIDKIKNAKDISELPKLLRSEKNLNVYGEVLTFIEKNKKFLTNQSKEDLGKLIPYGSTIPSFNDFVDHFRDSEDRVKNEGYDIDDEFDKPNEVIEVMDKVVKQIINTKATESKNLKLF